MKKTILASLMFSMLPFSASFASGPAVTGTASETGLAGGCGLPFDVSRIDFKRGEANVEQDAQTKCGSKAIRSTTYRIATECFRSRVWNAAFVKVSFSADFQCE